MLIKKLSIFVIIFFLILPSIILNASSQEDDEYDPENLSLLEKLLRFRYRIASNTDLGIGRYIVRQMRPPVPLQASPETINLNYLNQTTFEIGGIDIKTGGWAKLVKQAGTWNWAWINSKVSFSFEFVPPDDAPEGVWNVMFDPPLLTVYPNRENLDWPGADQLFKTNMTVFLKESPDPYYPTQDVILRVNIWREEVLEKYDILRGAPKYATTQREEYLQKCEELDVPAWWTPEFVSIYNLIYKYSMFLGNRPLPNYDKWIDSTVEILIKVERYHQAEIIPPLPQEIEPYQVKSIPVTIKNIGSHIDTYNFRVTSSDENLIVTPPPTLTLKPGEEGQALVGVAAPRTFRSVGSTANIRIDAYSVEDPDAVISNSITVTTSGLNVTGTDTYFGIISFTFLLIITFLVLIYIRKRKEKVSKKPEKPWEIPEEKEYLEKLKEKDKKEYTKVLQMMEEEYESVLLWYKYYVSSKLKEIKEEKLKLKQKRIKEAKKEKQKKIKEAEKTKKEKIGERIQSKKEKEEEKAAKKEEKISEIEEIEPEEPEIEEIELKESEIEEETTPVVDEKEEMEKRKKKQVLLRIRREQEKQKRKFGK